MNHLILKRVWWGNTRDPFGEFGYGMEYKNGSRATCGKAKGGEAAAEQARKLAAEKGVPAELIDFRAMAEDRRAAMRRLADLGAAQATENALDANQLRTVTPSTSWSIDFLQYDDLCWPGAIVNEPPDDDRAAVSERLASRCAENRKFKLTQAGELLRMIEQNRPRSSGYVFAIIGHPEHGLLAVTSEEFEALGLPEIEVPA